MPLNLTKFSSALQHHLATQGFDVVIGASLDQVSYDRSKEAEIQAIIDGWTQSDEDRFNALVELEETDAYFDQPRVKEDAMRGIITSEHQAMIDRRDALRLIVSGSV